MKIRSLLLIPIGLMTISGAPAETATEKEILAAESRYRDGRIKSQADYRQDLAAIIEKGDRIDVYLLDFEMEDTPSNFLFWDMRLEEGEFPILPYGKKSKILKRTTLTAEQREAFLPKLLEVVRGGANGGAFCHYPIHGVRIFSGEEIIFQSSFCWECSNFAIRYPDSVSWAGIEGDAIAKAFAKIMPIPQSEIDRFRSRDGKEQ